MASKGSKKHLKRYPAPAKWKLPRKVKKFVTKPSPGPHSIENSLPLLLIVRDLLGYADNGREAKKIIKMGKILVDGVVRKDHKFPVGLMDILSIPDTGEDFLVLFDKKGRITLKKTDRNDMKLCKIRNKTVIKGGHIQLNLHDGRNQIVYVSDPTKAEEDVYKTGDTVILSIPEQKLLDHIPFEEGKLAYITGGKHIGDIARIISVEKRKLHPDIVTLETKDGEEFKTIKDYVFVVGDEEPVLSALKNL
ncbi:30S ribosomal protein S4e [Methanofervidicoccus sp. A16]|uniref:30S ribosomal protein S4e n=1 Tax=Methanofervidicoccus sp. A16 TaxID=2607662 RepID=UPI00118842E3|nr:30S ribosomal protein S4e [Methanofervidicoccus sp. A16]AXI25213.1 30S ribosomal protein S4e [Methanofervidicoccus sp. A16]